MKPASSASTSMAPSRACSAASRADVLAGRTIQAHHGRPDVRMPDEGGDIGPQRQRFERLDVLLAALQVLCSSTMRRRARAVSPPPGRTGRPPPRRSTCTVDSEHEPITIVVTPCRTDSDSAGAASTSAS